MKYDLIISNPPYRSPGNTITKNIIENVDYDCFVNLLPSNDYRRYDKKFKLYQFVDMSTVRPIINSFKDAVVTTMLCRVMKERQYTRESEFEIKNYIDKSLDKYFTVNAARNHYAIDNSKYHIKPEIFEMIDDKKSICLGMRDMNHCHLPYNENSVTNLYNHNKITKEEILNMTPPSCCLKN